LAKSIVSRSGIVPLIWLLGRREIPAIRKAPVL
jgi:hypothetical protein